jgi:signal transduction histidine kinase/CheY-like chemotaxis protein
MAIGILLSGLAYALAARADEARVRAILGLRAEWRTRDLEARIKEFEAPLRATAIFIGSRQALDSFSFRRFVTGALAPDAPIRRVIWAPLVEADQRPAFERGQLFPGLGARTILERAADGSIQRAGNRDLYAPIVFEREITQGPAVGFDMVYEGVRRAAAMRARDDGVPVSTPPLIGRRAAGDEPFYLVFYPIYRYGGTPPPADERRFELRGFAVGLFPIGAVLSAAMRGTPEIVETIGFALRAPGAAGERVVARYAPSVGGITLVDALPPPAARGVHMERSFVYLGEEWHLSFDFDPAVLSDLRSSAPLAWLLAGLVLTAAIAAYSFRERLRVVATERVVAERTLQLERATTSLAQARKMEALGQLTGGIAHDFNNLLGVVIGNLDLAREELRDGSAAAGLTDAAVQAAIRGGELIRSLLAFARRQPLQPRTIFIADVLDDLMPLLHRSLGEQIRIVPTVEPGLWPITADPVQLQTAILNLAINARDAMAGGGVLTVDGVNVNVEAESGESFRELPSGDYAMICIADDGVGMAPDVLERAFEPFFTTKTPGDGTGLGLSMVYGFMKQSGGAVQIYSEPGHGTAVRLYLPRAAPAPGAPAEAAPALPEPGGGERILVVEDRLDMRRAVVQMLDGLGYRHSEADSGAAALALLDEGERFDLLFTDIVMPGPLNGFDLARAARRREPSLKLLFSSGFPGPVATRPGVEEFGAEMIVKPYRKADLAAALRRVLGDAPALPALHR